MRSLGVVTTSSILVTIVVTCVAATVLPAMAVIEGLWIVGVGGADPDSVSLDSQKAYCTFDSTHTSSPTFTSKDLSDWPRVDEDLDVLASSSLTGNAEFSPSELSALVAALDINRTNLLGVDETDLQLIINYLSVASSYDSTAVDTTQFILFPSCADDELAEEYDLDHFDLYLVRAGVDDTVGCYDSNFTSPLEDVPAGVGYGEFHWNSFQVLDRGNATGDTVLWPVRAASGATHEAQHALWESDKCEHGSMRSHGDFNEFFASAASVMAKPPPRNCAVGQAIRAVGSLHALCAICLWRTRNERGGMPGVGRPTGLPHRVCNMGSVRGVPY
ncbi:MAG: hypothetical protein JXE06_10670 [Coriobacteriia bacterium]|nr:hypothetical protein [Coriobacteriia bacterium]